MDDVDVIGVPFDGYGRAGHQAGAADALRAAGLPAAVGGRDLGDLDLPAGDPRRGASTTLVNEAALLEQTRQLAARVAAVLDARRFPLVVGGDCTSLLGTVRGMHDALGAAAVLFLDGHEDTMPLDVSEDGEAANAEIGLLLGLTGRTLRGPLAAHRGLLFPATLAVAGPRDAAWRARFNVGSLATSASGSATPRRSRPSRRRWPSRRWRTCGAPLPRGGCTSTSTSSTPSTSRRRACRTSTTSRAG